MFNTALHSSMHTHKRIFKLTIMHLFITLDITKWLRALYQRQQFQTFGSGQTALTVSCSKFLWRVMVGIVADKQKQRSLTAFFSRSRTIYMCDFICVFLLYWHVRFHLRFSPTFACAISTAIFSSLEQFTWRFNPGYLILLRC